MSVLVFRSGLAVIYSLLLELLIVNRILTSAHSRIPLKPAHQRMIFNKMKAFECSLEGYITLNPPR